MRDKVRLLVDCDDRKALVTVEMDSELYGAYCRMRNAMKALDNSELFKARHAVADALEEFRIYMKRKGEVIYLPDDGTDDTEGYDDD